MATLPLIPTITPLPDAPSRQDADNFDTRADAFLAAMENLPTELNAAFAVMNGEIKDALEASPGTAAYQAAAEAQASAAAAKNSEMNAAASAGAASGLATGAGVWSGEQSASFVDAETLRLTGNWTEAAHVGRALTLVQTLSSVVRVVSATYNVGGYTDVVVDGAVDSGLATILWGVPSLALPFTIGTGADQVPRNSDLGTAAYADIAEDPAAPGVGDVLQAVDDGEGNPALPAVDGSRLLNIPGATVFATSLLSITNGGYHRDIAHGLGSAPDMVIGELECITSSNDVTTGYLPLGALLAIPLGIIDNSGLSVDYDATYLQVAYAPTVTLSYKRFNTGLLTLDNTKFNLRIRAIKF